MAGTLRVVVDGPREPEFNMALDESLMLRYRGLDTLRIYLWSPPAVSVGRRQDAASAVRLGEAVRRGFRVVRRPSGGLALLHGIGIDVTYSLVSGSGWLLEASVDESARAIARGVEVALRRLGLDASTGGGRGGALVDPVVCLANRGAADVYVGEYKVSGSAQLRRGSVLLQHGVVLVRFDAALWASLLRSRLGPRELGESIAGLEDLGWRGGFKDIVDALVAGFGEALGLEPIMGGLTPEEVELALRLRRARYGLPGWRFP